MEPYHDRTAARSGLGRSSVGSACPSFARVATFAVRPLFDRLYFFSPRLAIGGAAVLIVAAAVGLVCL